MDTPRRVGLNPELYCRPVFHGLTGRPEFLCTTDVVAKNAILMRGHDLDAAFLSPIDYARQSSEYLIVPDVAVSSRLAGNTITLHFKEGLHTLNTLAVHPTSTSEVVLASVLLGERFDVKPTIVPVMGSLDQMMRSADAALLVGNVAFDGGLHHPNKLDLVEEWYDMTDMPYVHGFWCVREDSITREEIALIQQAREFGLASLDEIVSSELSRHHSQSSPVILKQYLENFSYSFTDEEQEGATEFLRYAFYHGSLPDVPDLNFYPMVDQEDDSAFPGPSLN